MSTKRHATIRRGNRVFAPNDPRKRTGRVIDTTHLVAVVLWAPTLEFLDRQDRLGVEDGANSMQAETYSFNDLKLC